MRMLRWRSWTRGGMGTSATSWCAWRGGPDSPPVIESFVVNKHRLKHQFRDDLEALEQAVEEARKEGGRRAGPKDSTKKKNMPRCLTLSTPRLQPC